MMLRRTSTLALNHGSGPFTEAPIHIITVNRSLTSPLRLCSRLGAPSTTHQSTRSTTGYIRSVILLRLTDGSMPAFRHPYLDEATALSIITFENLTVVTHPVVAHPDVWVEWSSIPAYQLNQLILASCRIKYQLSCPPMGSLVTSAKNNCCTINLAQ